MPILASEPDLFPDDLLDRLHVSSSDGSDRWWALYTLSRREKKLMRQLRSLEIAHYSPLVGRRHRSPAGRVRVSYEPLFANYVFMHGSEHQRHAALGTNSIARWFVVPDPGELTRDLRQVRQLIQTGRPLTVEARLQTGDLVRVRQGAFAGFEGVVLRRKNETRLLVAVNFLQRGASVLLDDCQLEPLGRSEPLAR